MTDKQDLELKYIGVCSLLARLMPSVNDFEERQTIASALLDAGEILDFESRPNGNGWWFEPKKRYYCGRCQREFLTGKDRNIHFKNCTYERQL